MKFSEMPYVAPLTLLLLSLASASAALLPPPPLSCLLLHSHFASSLLPSAPLSPRHRLDPSDLSRLTWILSPSRGSFMSRFLYSCVHMEMHTVSSAAADSDSLKCSLVESLVAQTAVLADKSLLFLLLLVWSSPNENNVFPYPVRTDQRFPTSDLNTVKEPDAENNDAGEAEDDNDGDGDDDDDEDEDNDEDDGNDSEDDSDDDEEDSDGEIQAAGYGDSDDDDEDNDADDDSDEDDDSDDEDDEEQYKLPSQRKK